MLDTPVFAVSEFIEALNHHLALLGEVVVEGEITRMDVKNRNLIFITIKDKASAIDVFTMAHMLKNYSQFEPGMLVHVYGTAGLYKGSGKFRLFASRIVPHGEGALQIAFERLKKALETEGLFDPSHKRPLPAWPKHIGLITAKNSSAYYDQVKIISARMGGITLKHLPVSVQGREAVPTILKAFEYVNNHKHDFDVVILARGGGSLEDLAAFNSEEVCRAVFGCKVPVISAVGHEDDWSLTDFVADMRASTPSNAAEQVVRDKGETTAELDHTYMHLKHQVLHLFTIKKQAIMSSRLVIRHHIKSLSAQLSLTLQKVPLMAHSLKHAITLKAQDVSHLERLLESLDYRNVLKRGYSITRDHHQHIIINAQTLKKGESISTQLATGFIHSIIS